MGTRSLNIEIQRYYQHTAYGVTTDVLEEKQKPKILIGDKVIQTKNNYKVGIMNGDCGVVVSKTEDEKAFVIRFEPDHFVEIPTNENNLELAYALTIHKVQGSEYPVVAVVVHSSHTFQHNNTGRNLFYTAVTRASKTAIIIGNPWGINNCAKVESVNKRRTLLYPMFYLYQQQNKSPQVIQATPTGKPTTNKLILEFLR